jgi:hypothetical protein
VSTVTWGSTVYLGHWEDYYCDPACYPSSTTDRGPAAWAQYYC